MENIDDAQDIQNCSELFENLEGTCFPTCEQPFECFGL